MLIKRAADTYEKIQALGGMASDEIECRPGQAGAAGGTGPFDKLRASVGDRGPEDAHAEATTRSTSMLSALLTAFAKSYAACI